jgi:hypothetical protein
VNFQLVKQARERHSIEGNDMKWCADSENLRPLNYEISHDPLAGFYVYVFEGDKCVRDHLQESLEAAMEMALEEYHVPQGAWRKIE